MFIYLNQSTFCGTPEFMAPEILLEQRYGRAVDWWAFGVLIYEMLLGQSPFRGDDEDEIFDAILEDEPLYPIHMPRDSVSILQKLLTRDPLRRLGGGPTDAEEIKCHPFFRETVWEDVYRKRIPAPYFPTVVRGLFYFVFEGHIFLSWIGRADCHVSDYFRTDLWMCLTLTRSSPKKVQD